MQCNFAKRAPGGRSGPCKESASAVNFNGQELKPLLIYTLHWRLQEDHHQHSVITFHNEKLLPWSASKRASGINSSIQLAQIQFGIHYYTISITKLYNQLHYMHSKWNSFSEWLHLNKVIQYSVLIKENPGFYLLKNKCSVFKEVWMWGTKWFLCMRIKA